MEKRNKGVSPIIATLLLVVIAIAAATVTYAFVVGYVGNQQLSGVAKSSISIDAAGAGVISVRNVGDVAAVVSAIYLGGADLIWQGFETIQPKSFSVISFDASGISGYHRLKVVCVDGAAAWSETIAFG